MMHTTVELERQWDAAKSRLDAAARAEREARERLKERAIIDRIQELAVAGFPVGRAVVRGQRRDEPELLISSVVSVKYGGPMKTQILYKAFKKDGTPGVREYDRYIPTLELIRLLPEA
jgi:hypothetical protein